MGRHKKPVDRLGQILKVAAGLFINKGFLNTTVRDIAAKCNMNVATLYHYIGSKQKILGLFQEYTTGLLENFVEEHKEALNQMGPEEALTYAIEKYLTWVEEYQDVTVFWHQETKNLTSKQFDSLAVQEESTIQVFQSLIERGIKDGKFKPADACLAAHNIIVLCDMWAFQRWLLRKRYSLDEFIKYQTELILSQVRGRNH
jgi:TetR/AcrR family transcriptional regulator, cholesterol catabolism regulator